MIGRIYTSPEQSEYLINLGLPVESADCYYTSNFEDGNFIGARIDILQNGITHEIFSKNKIYLPCWSIGQLMEIFDECSLLSSSNLFDYCCDIHLEGMIKLIDDSVKKDIINFNYIKLKKDSEEL